MGCGGGTRSLIIWGLAPSSVAQVFGVAGRTWRVGPQRQRAVALGLLVAVAVAEGIYNAVVLGAPATGAGFVIAGLCVPIVLGRSRDDRLGAYVAAIPALGLAALGYLALTLFAGVAAGLSEPSDRESRLIASQVVAGLPGRGPVGRRRAA